MLPRHVYVHVPFCARRCTYCDFAIAVRRTVPVDDYVAAVRAELGARFRAAAPAHIDTLYMGGGTPSRLGADGVARLIGELRAFARWDDDAEVTLEANPDDVTGDAARAWRAEGINRLSIGAQSFDARVLRWMHRTHGPGQVERAVDAARAAGISSLSIDLIFALPESLDRDWSADLARVVALEPDHVSLYGLIVEQGTPLGRQRDRGLVEEAPEERYEREFLRAHEVLTDRGLEHYEVSNYARPGRRARHNSSYWRHVPYAGIGPSAHSFDGARRRWNARDYVSWERAVRAGRDPLEGEEVLSEENLASERVYLALRTTDGLPLDVATRAMADPWVAAGWAEARDDRLRLTPSGWLRLDSISAALTLVESRS